VRHFKTFVVAMAAIGALAVGAWAEVDVTVKFNDAEPLIPAEEAFVALGSTIILGVNAELTGEDAENYKLAFQWYSCGEATCGNNDPEAQIDQDDGLTAVNSDGDADEYELTAGTTAEILYYRVMVKAVATEDDAVGDSVWSEVITVNVVAVVESIAFTDEDVLVLVLSSDGTATLNFENAGVAVDPTSFTDAVTWEVHDAGGTGAAINDAVLTVNAAGTATIRASIADGAINSDDTELLTFTKDFTVTVVEESTPPVVTIDITEQPDFWQAFEVGTIEETDVLKVEAELSIEDATIELVYQWFQCEIADDAEVSADLTTPANPEDLAAWLKNCADIEGNTDWEAITDATDAELAIPAELAVGAYAFYVAISAIDAGTSAAADAIDPIVSDIAVVIVYEAPEPGILITEQPANQKVVVDETPDASVTLTVAAEIVNGEAEEFTIVFQWFGCDPAALDGEGPDFIDCSDIDNFTEIQDANGATFDAPIDVAGIMRYYVLVSDEDESLEPVASAIATVEVLAGDVFIIISVNDKLGKIYDGSVVGLDDIEIKAVAIDITAEEAEEDGLTLTVVTTLDNDADIDLDYTWLFCVVVDAEDENAEDCYDVTTYASLPSTGFAAVENTLVIASDVLEAGRYYSFMVTVKTDEEEDGEPAPRETIGFVIVSVDGEVGILEIDREVPAVVEEPVVTIVPTRAATSQLVVGPSPVAIGNVVNFFWQNTSGKLRVFDASGKFVREVTVAKGWDLKDAHGRFVVEGTYVVRGVLVANDGSRVRVSAPVTVVR
jgi:hypothetical protein